MTPNKEYFIEISFIVHVSLDQLTRTLHNIYKEYGSNIEHATYSPH